MIIKRTTRHQILSLPILPTTPINPIRQTLMFIKPRMEFALAPSNERLIEIDDFETIVHRCDEKSIRVGRVPFESPDSSSGVEGGERE